jgi:two-component system, OmpR family, sensor histidine kinase VicK
MTQSSPNQVFGIDHIDNNGTKITKTAATVADDTNNDNEIMQIITGAENITNFNLQHYLTTRIKIDACFDNVAPSVFASDERIMNGITKLKERGIKIRLITDITKDNIDYCKEIMKISEIRHLEGVKGNFGIIDEREYNIHIIHQESKAPTQIIYCNVKSSAEAQQFLFNTLWNKAILADQRIREIEEGIKPDFIETIRDPIEIARIRSEIINSATEEILIMIPTVNDFYRQEQEGLLQLLKQAAERNIQVKVLTPMDNAITETAKKLTAATKTNYFNIRLLCGLQQQQTKSTIIISDTKLSLAVELKDDTKSKFIEAIGLSSYSNSKPTVWTYTSVFENLWMQTEIVLQNKRGVMQ